MDDAGNTASMTAAGALLMRLKALGVDYIFANSGTDFPPIIEGAAQALHDGVSLPEMIVAPHEHAALGMAHGVYLASGQPQAVMLHTNVGLAKRGNRSHKRCHRSCADAANVGAYAHD